MIANVNFCCFFLNIYDRFKLGLVDIKSKEKKVVMDAVMMLNNPAKICNVRSYNCTLVSMSIFIKKKSVKKKTIFQMQMVTYVCNGKY